MRKETLLKRLELLTNGRRTVEIPLEILFDRGAWKAPLKEIELFSNIKQTMAPNQVYSKLRELNEKPLPYFAIRNEALNKLIRYPKNNLNLEELTNLFEEDDKLTIGKFQPLGTENDFFTKLNRIYYGVLGQKAFTMEGKVPIKFSNNPLIQEANAINLYNKIEGGDFGEKDKVIIQKWGSGGLLDPVKSFLEKIIELDELNNTQVYKRIKYTVSDISKKSIKDAINKANTEKCMKRYIDDKVLQFEVFDARKPSKRNIANIESSYLYDSISQPIIAKRDGKFYELHYRAYVSDFECYDPIKKNNGELVEPIEFKKWIEEEDLKKLSQLAPRSFNNINWEVKYVRIKDIKQYPNGKNIEEILKGIDNITLPTGETNLTSIRKALESLRKNGYVQLFDIGIPHKDTITPKNECGTIYRYNGSVYSAVNFFLIAKTLSNEKIKGKLEHITDYLENTLGERVIPTSCLSYCTRETKDMDRFFPIELIKKYEWIINTANKIKKEKGYSHRGKIDFYNKMYNEGLIKWSQGCTFICEGNIEDYVADYRKSLGSFMNFRFFGSDVMWLYEESPNPLLLQKFDFLGFEKGIIKHLFKHHQEISIKLNYYHMRLENAKE